MKLLFENFEKIIDSPNGFEKARQLIIGLAIKGELVDRLSSDEPAQKLIRRIAETKESLIKKRIIKKQKDLEEIEEIPFTIPHSWVWARLGNLGSIYNGNSISAQTKAEKYSNVKEGYDYIATKDVKFNSSTLNYDNGIKIPTEENKFKIAKKNSVLICSEGGSAGRKVGITEKDVCFGNKLFTIDTFIDLPAKYFYYVFNSVFFFEQFKSGMTGIIGGISLTNFKSLVFPLPPLNEQKRIVEKVDSLMSFLDELEEKRNRREEKRIQLNSSSLDKLVKSKDEKEFQLNWNRITDNFDKLYSVTENVDKLKQTILQLAVQGKLTEQWRKENPDIEPASELLKKIKAEKEKLIKEGKIKKKKELPLIKEEEKPFELPDSWEWVRLGSLIYIKSGDGLTSQKMIQGKIPVFGGNGINGYHCEYNVDKATLVIGRVGYYCGSVHITPSNAWITDNAFKTIFPENLLDIHFVALLLRTFDLKKDESATAQPVISGRKIYPIPLALPPFAEQRQILRKVNELMKHCNQLEQQIESKQQRQEKLVEAVVNKLEG